jgi:hypothetical protein
MSLAGLYPEGRTIYGEDDDPSAFLKVCADLGLDPIVKVEVPADKLDRFYRATRDMRIGT